MIKGLVLLALSAVFVSQLAAQAEKSLYVDFCTVIQQPKKFTGEMIEVRALQTKLKKGEWGLLGDCWPPILLQLPEDVSPKPEFTLEESPALKMLLAARNERVSFTATFLGRFDHIDSKSSERGARSAQTFGKSKMAMRFILQRVSDPERIVLPYK